MKLQTLTVIFILILLPITMVVSSYINTEINSITTQTMYDTRLTNATYDAIKSFQLNEQNSNDSDVTKEKMRNVEASINSFYSSLSAGMGVSGYTEDDLKDYIPCLLYGLYDGYYIYTSYSDSESKEKTHGLKPYVYYTEELNSGNGQYTITYTLDNYITIIGKDNENNTITKSGYLCLDDNLSISEENLTEEIVLDNEIIYSVPYVYKKFDGTKNIKYYYVNGTWYSYGTAGKLIEEKNNERIKELNERIKNNNVIEDNSAQNYVSDNSEFTKWVSDTFGNSYKWLKISKDNNPDNYSSEFNEHRREVIQKSIKSNLEATIINYRNGATEFKIPELAETEWDKIINNVSLTAFMQGLPLKNKLYMGYSVVTNTQSKEFVNPNEIYIVVEDNRHERKYHNVTCKSINNLEETEKIQNAYRNIDFRRKSFTYNDNNGEAKTGYYYPQEGIACYECLVSPTNIYESVEEALENNSNLKNIYYRALYRERYVNYKSLDFGN